MRRIAALPLLLAFGCLGACTETVEGSDARIGMAAGKILLAGKPFTGIIKQEIAGDFELRQTTYRDGLEHGRFTVHKKGKLVEEREYVHGHKHGTHRGWHTNGNLKFVSNFDQGAYTGDQYTYHDNGQVFEYKKYTHAGKLLISKIFRQSGQVYTSQAFSAEGAAYGLPGSKLCNPVSQEKAKQKLNQSKSEQDLQL
jgi:hypothetical protein